MDEPQPKKRRKRRKPSLADLGHFIDEYARKSNRHNFDPNDRQYSRVVEKRVKAMKPEELDRLLRDEDDEESIMPRDNEHNPDPNANASRIVRESTTSADTLPDDVEAAWQAWSSHIQNVDERARTLLRAAFEAGYDAASRPRPC